MMKLTLLTALSCLISLGIGAQTIHLPALGETSSRTQVDLRKTEAWVNFANTNGDWYPRFDERTGMPHRAFGTPIPVSSRDPETMGREFVKKHLAPFEIRNDALEFISSRRSKHLYIDFKQIHQGLEVLFSRITIRINKNDGVFLFGADYHPNIFISIDPSVDDVALGLKASQGLGASDLLVSEELKILPVPGNERYDYYLVKEVRFTAFDESNGTPGEWYALVDAHSAELLYRSNQSQPIRNINVEADVNLTHPIDPPTFSPLRNIRVTKGLDQYYSDSMAVVSLPDSVDSALVHLDGLWCDIVTGQNGTESPSFFTAVDSNTSIFSFDTVAPIQHRSGYYHVNVVHDIMKRQFPAFTLLDFPLVTHIDYESAFGCNAFYRRMSVSINFFIETTCNSYARVADVVYHEYGHAINHQFYIDQGVSFDNGGLGEGTCDVWGFNITGSPYIGLGQTNDTADYIRRYDIDPKVYPQDLGGSHDNGEIIAGSWWDVAQSLGSMAMMFDLFTETYFALPNAPNGQEGRLFRNVLMDALVADDNDGDLTNGTPNGVDIVCAFAIHGITLIDNLAGSHTPLATHVAWNDIELSADLSGVLGWYLQNANIRYRTDDSSVYSTALMTDDGTGIYRGTIPGPPPGTIVQYYIEINNICGTSDVTPERVTDQNPNIPYYLLVGFASLSLQNFEDYGISWTTSAPDDDATRGIWEIDQPLGSYINPSSPTPQTLVQPGFDRTEIPTDGVCAITENAVSTILPAGVADVDGGRTSLLSPIYDLSAMTEPAFGYFRWYTNDVQAFDGDQWQVYISGNGIDWKPVELTSASDRSWRHYAFKVKDLITPTSSTQLKFVAEDIGTPSIVEAALDDLTLYDIDFTGVSDRNDLKQLIIFPNPSSGEFTIYLPGDFQKKKLNYIINKIFVV